MIDDVAQSVLDVIAAGESPDYNTIYGGHKFSSLRDHPNIRVPLPDGKITTAAGRYQLLHPTWADEKKRLGLKDFSPDSQDAAAWDLASRTYKQRTGRELADDAAGGAVAWDALANQWPSLHRLDSPQQEGQIMPQGLAGQPPTPASQQPFLPVGGKTDLQYTPVDYDPFSTNELGVPSNASIQ